MAERRGHLILRNCLTPLSTFYEKPFLKFLLMGALLAGAAGCSEDNT